MSDGGNGPMDTKERVFIGPGAPDVGPIHHLHRGNGGFVTLHRKGQDGFENIAAIPAARLEGCFPGFVEELDRDAYYSVNSFYKGNPSKAHPGRLMPSRRRSDLQWLTACYTDLDLGRDGTPTVGFAIGAIIDLQGNGTIPPASMFVRSGRGLWLFWVLRNDDPRYPADGPVRAWPEMVDAYSRVQREINRRLAFLEADPDAIDACRITRIPGSMHAKAERRVAYWVQADADGNGYAYTLNDLCAWFGVSPPRISPAKRKSIDPIRIEKGRRGFHARWARALEQFESARSMRSGCFVEGHRFYVCRLYASLLLTNGVSDAEAKVAVLQLAAGCNPPLPKVDAHAALKAALRLTNMSGQTIANTLRITVEESERLTSWPPSVKNSPPVEDDPPTPTRKEKAEFRRQTLHHFVCATGRVPTYREASDVLVPFGLNAAPETLMRDYRAMGLRNPRARKPADTMHVQTEHEV